MVNFIIKSNSAQVMNNMAKRIKKMQSDGKRVTLDVAKFGAKYAYNIAPKKTGATARAIGWTKGNGDGSTATIVFGDGHPERRGLIKKKYGLTYYMNFVGNPSYWYSGKAKFISLTSGLVSDKFHTGVRKVVNAFVNGK